GVAVKPWFTDQDFRPPSELARHALNLSPQIVDALAVVARRARNAGRSAVFAEPLAQHFAPFAGGHAGFGAGDRRLHYIAARLRGTPQVGKRGLHRRSVPRGAPRPQAGDLVGLDLGRHRENGALLGLKRRRLGFGEAIDTDDDLLTAFDRLDPARIALDELRFHVAVLNRRHRAAHAQNGFEFVAGLKLERCYLSLDLGRAGKDVAVFQQIGLVGEDLLHAQRPLLIPRARQAKRLVPRGELNRTGASLLRQRNGQHLDQDAVDVVLGLLLGKAKRVHLDAVAEQALLGVGDAVPFGRDLVPQLREGAHLAQLGDEPQAGIDEERDAADDLAELRRFEVARRLHRVEHGERGGERKAEFLHRCRAGFLQVIGAHVHRIPLRQLARREQDHVPGQPHGGAGRKYVGAARQVFLDYVVLGRALQVAALDALLVGNGDVERQQPRRSGVDGHGGVHGVERDAVEQRPHVAEVTDRNTDLADFSAGKQMVSVIPSLGRQIEGDREAGLAFGKVFPIERVRSRRGRMPRIGANDPWLVTFLRRTIRGLDHACLLRNGNCALQHNRFGGCKRNLRWRRTHLDGPPAPTS